jgi:hypothetical protein
MSKSKSISKSISKLVALLLIPNAIMACSFPGIGSRVLNDDSTLWVCSGREQAEIWRQAVSQSPVLLARLVEYRVEYPTALDMATGYLCRGALEREYTGVQCFYDVLGQVALNLLPPHNGSLTETGTFLTQGSPTQRSFPGQWGKCAMPGDTYVTSTGLTETANLNMLAMRDGFVKQCYIQKFTPRLFRGIIQIFGGIFPILAMVLAVLGCVIVGILYGAFSYIALPIVLKG